jgi:hypothetical protein
VGSISSSWNAVSWMAMVGVEGEAVALLQASGDGVAGECAEMGEDVCEVDDSWPTGVRLLLESGRARSDIGLPSACGCAQRRSPRIGPIDWEPRRMSISLGRPPSR